MKCKKALGMLLLSVLLAGCCMAPGTGKAFQEDNGSSRQADGGDITVKDPKTPGGLSDPNKCRGLPPQQMADCLEEAMGG